MLAERFGWTFDEIDNLDITEYQETCVLLDAIDKAAAFRARSKP